MIEKILSIDFLISTLRLMTPLLFTAMAAVIGGKANVLWAVYWLVLLVIT